MACYYYSTISPNSNSRLFYPMDFSPTLKMRFRTLDPNETDLDCEGVVNYFFFLSRGRINWKEKVRLIHHPYFTLRLFKLIRFICKLLQVF